MTPIQIIDKVEAHLKTMSRRSADHINCRYRSATGEMCAVGCLIPDDKYLPEWDSHEAAYLPQIIPVLVAAGLQITEALGVSLQQIHDNVYNWVDEKFVGDFTNLRRMYDTPTNH